ncbi:MAG: hypothetical protein K2N52_02240, partial [Clostridia bacterium]|nr:hypothetical protein [Clostridia bacterium]
TVTITGAVLGVVQISSIKITANVGRVRNITIKGFNAAEKTLLHAESAAQSSASANEIINPTAVLKKVNPTAVQKVFCPKQLKKLLTVSPSDGIIYSFFTL